jgi:hypothetical protein
VAIENFLTVATMLGIKRVSGNIIVVCSKTAKDYRVAKIHDHEYYLFSLPIVLSCKYLSLQCC